MLRERRFVPLSPPTSPCMSEAGQSKAENQWQQHSAQPMMSGFPVPPLQHQPQPYHVSGAVQDPPRPVHEFARPTSRSNSSFRYTLGPSSRSQPELRQDSASSSALSNYDEAVTSQHLQHTGTPRLQSAPLVGSAHTSPVVLANLTPRSPEGVEQGTQDRDEDKVVETDQAGEVASRPPLTAAELRAQKRKMKRFRLTHAQTRFLLSEFARQPHPDAAQRERLSREIPGLSSRQVQVWFQNRRAKLKRLTNDDRESMMRSRALPAHFDATHTLQSPFRDAGPSGSTPIHSPGTFVPFGESGVARSVQLDAFRAGLEPHQGPQYGGPTGVAPTLGSFAFTSPQSATGAISPASGIGNAAQFSFQTSESSRRHSIPFPTHLQAQYTGYQPPVPRAQTFDSLGRPTGEQTPLRSSIPYSPLDGREVAQIQTAQKASPPEPPFVSSGRPQPQRSLTGSVISSSSPYGLGFSYNEPASYNGGQQQRRQVELPAQQTSPKTRPNHAQPSQPYEETPNRIGDPSPTTYQSYQSTHLAPPHAPAYAHVPNQFQSGQMPPPFPLPPTQQQPSHQRPIYPSGQYFNSLPLQAQGYLPLGSSTEIQTEEGDNNDGGAPLPAAYR